MSWCLIQRKQIIHDLLIFNSSVSRTGLALRGFDPLARLTQLGKAFGNRVIGTAHEVIDVSAFPGIEPAPV